MGYVLDAEIPRKQGWPRLGEEAVKLYFGDLLRDALKEMNAIWDSLV